ncbi:hypothetical protein GQ43DRAFT_435759 [Delitschia confertaspora ATCC 74209]|uniref:Protein kinase domain-containing protein n=1 Tax=Delitschia confertaspora ATCC 74209 TaxID=1513339 RepID=A0A9P4JF51_9PLEO|nr:hypothetical protein GQ43DRAFT_435759 [Delitschia confertaspora ATCC 74209]
MSPVAEMDLRDYLTHTTISNYPELRTLFGCLAVAFEFPHEQKVRHKDTNPSELSHRRCKWQCHHGHNEHSDSKYCAPEVAQYESRNTQSDIGSLGVIFIEIVVVLKSKRIQEMEENFQAAWMQASFSK